MDCGRCGHSIELHGRRGHGSCRQRGWTEYGRGEAERIVAERDGTDKTVTAFVLRTLLMLPGMHGTCECKRFLKRTPKEAVAQ